MFFQPIIIEGIELEIIPKSIRNLNLRITPPQGIVIVTVPYGYPYNRIEQFVRSKSAWIKKHQARIRNAKYVAPLKYETGEKHYFLGKPYILTIVEGRRGMVEMMSEFQNCKVVNQYQDYKIAGLQDHEIAGLDDHGIFGTAISEGTGDGSFNSLVPSEMCSFRMTVQRRSSRKKRQSLLDEWYRARMKEIVPQMIAKYEALMPVKSDAWGIKKMRTKWGTCNTRVKRIWINLELAKKPLAEIEHVVVHELVHLMERRHNATFHRLVREYLAKGNG